MQTDNNEELKKHVLTLTPELSEFINNLEPVKTGKCTRNEMIRRMVHAARACMEVSESFRTQLLEDIRKEAEREKLFTPDGLRSLN